MEMISKNWYKRNNEVIILKKLECYAHLYSYEAKVDIPLNINKKEKHKCM